MLKYASGLSLIAGLLLIFLAVDKTDALRLLGEMNSVWPFLLGIVLIPESASKPVTRSCRYR